MCGGLLSTGGLGPRLALPRRERLAIVDHTIVEAFPVDTLAIICERHIWNDPDGGATMVVWSRKAVPLPDGRKNTVRRL